MKENLYKDKCLFIEMNFNDTFEFHEVDKIEDEVYRKSEQIKVDNIEEINFPAEDDSTGVFSQISVNNKNSKMKNTIEKYDIIWFSYLIEKKNFEEFNFNNVYKSLKNEILLSNNLKEDYSVIFYNILIICQSNNIQLKKNECNNKLYLIKI